jgi:hypothetical protein
VLRIFTFPPEGGAGPAQCELNERVWRAGTQVSRFIGRSLPRSFSLPQTVEARRGHSPPIIHLWDDLTTLIRGSLVSMRTFTKALRAALTVIAVLAA